MYSALFIFHIICVVKFLDPVVQSYLMTFFPFSPVKYYFVEMGNPPPFFNKSLKSMNLLFLHLTKS